MRPDMHDRCCAHARIAAKQAKMKGLDPEITATAFIYEAMQTVFGVDQATALELVKGATAYCWEFLQAKNIAEAEARGEDTQELRKSVDNERTDAAWTKSFPELLALPRRPPLP